MALGNKFTPTETNPAFDGVQNVYSFDNGYGASVVRHYMSYGGDRGLWEIAVLKDGELTYDTPITDDVIGFVPTDRVQDILESINAL